VRRIFFACLFACLPFVSPAEAQIVAQVSIAKQEMIVTHHGIEVHRWPVSTARPGFITPKGAFRVQSMHKRHFSRLFNNAPMPFSIFYSGHYAIHGTTDVRRLGRPASAGCVRLHPEHARALFEMVTRQGPAHFQVVVGS